MKWRVRSKVFSEDWSSDLYDSKELARTEALLPEIEDMKPRFRFDKIRIAVADLDRTAVAFRIWSWMNKKHVGFIVLEAVDG